MLFSIEKEAIYNSIWNIKQVHWMRLYNKIDFQSSFAKWSYVGWGRLLGVVFLGKRLGFNCTLLRFSLRTYPTYFSGLSKSWCSFFWAVKRWQCFWNALGKCQRIKPFGRVHKLWMGKIIWTLVYIAFFMCDLEKHGKDDHVTTTTSYYPPKGMDPRHGGLLDCMILVHTADWIPHVLSWASNGYLNYEEDRMRKVVCKGWHSAHQLKENEADAPLGIQRSAFPMDCYLPAQLEVFN